MNSSSAIVFVLRDLDPAREADFDWVAMGMHLTLLEVEGEKSRETYSPGRARAWQREMLDSPHPFDAKAFLAVAAGDPGLIVGHTIRRHRHDARRSRLRAGLDDLRRSEPPARASPIACWIAAGPGCLRTA